MPDDVVVEPPEEFLNRLRAAGKSTSALVDKLGFTRSVSAPQFFWNPERQVEMEVHVVDVHCFGSDQQVQKSKEDLAAHIWFRDGGVHHESAGYDQMKQFRMRLNGAVTIESNPIYLDAVLELLGQEGAKDVPTPSVPGHKENLTTGELLNPSEITVHR